MSKYPHCEHRVLHPPGDCEFCDMYPDLQKKRIDEGVNFTGEGDPNKKPCPAEEARGLENVNAWHRNRPYPKDTSGCPKCGNKGNWVNLALTCPTHGVF